MPSITTNDTASTGGRLVAADGRELILTKTSLQARGGGGLLRARLEQRFHNPYDEPLTLSYLLPLPADGAVHAFAFRIGERRIHGEIEKREDARQRFEEAIVEGRTAALLEQDRSSLFTQEIANVPPGAVVVAEVEVDQPLFWLQDSARARGQWEWRFPTTVAPRFMGEAGRVPDAVRTSVDILEDRVMPRLHLQLAIDDACSGAPSSTSHTLTHGRVANSDGYEVSLSTDDPAQLDRDVVVRWPVTQSEIGTRIEVADGHGLLTLVPPGGEVSSVLPRDVTVLFDTSGSMQGEPLEQARAVVCAFVESLTDHDRLEMIEFSTHPRRWTRSSKYMVARHKQNALRWLRGLRANGGTQMRDAVLEATQAIGTESQKQILLVTDGLIGFEGEIITAILDNMPRSSRFHVVAVGSAPNRSLTQAAARAGRGFECGVQLGEDVAALTSSLIEHTAQPLVVDLEFGGSAFLEAAPERIPDLFAACPARLAVRLRPEGGELVVRGRRAEGLWERRLEIPSAKASRGRDAVVTLFGREKIEDLEMRVAKGEDQDQVIEEIALRYRILSRMTSWIAIDSQTSVDPTLAMRRTRIPHQLAAGMSIEGLGLRPAMPRRLEREFIASEACIIGASPSRAGRQKRAKSALEMPPSGEVFNGDDAVQEEATSLDILTFGEFRRLPDGSLVMMFRLDMLDRNAMWQLPASVEVDWHGTSTTCSVDSKRSTASGSIPAGAVLRLTILLPLNADSALPSAVRASLGSSMHGNTITILPRPA